MAEGKTITIIQKGKKEEGIDISFTYNFNLIENEMDGWKGTVQCAEINYAIRDADGTWIDLKYNGWGRALLQLNSPTGNNLTSCSNTVQITGKYKQPLTFVFTDGSISNKGVPLHFDTDGYPVVGGQYYEIGNNVEISFTFIGDVNGTYANGDHMNYVQNLGCSI